VSLAAGRGNKILQFDTMVGVPAGLTGAQSMAPLRGINGGGLPWTVAEAHGDLRADGRLTIEVEGLVLATTGSNPIGVFRGLVSCVTSTGSFVNVSTDAFPATTGPASEGGGSGTIHGTVTLPSPCIAPIVFVTSNTGSWFASTGN
jgi:hypothetical protein